MIISFCFSISLTFLGARGFLGQKRIRIEFVFKKRSRLAFRLFYKMIYKKCRQKFVFGGIFTIISYLRFYFFNISWSAWLFRAENS